jgi:uncharacterized protein HemX
MTLIQKYIIYAMAIVVALLLGVIGYQYVNIQKAKITSLEQEKKQLLLVAEANEQNRKDAETAMRNMQSIKTEMSKKLDSAISGMSQGKCMSVQDEETFIDIFTAYNKCVQSTSNNKADK